MANHVVPRSFRSDFLWVGARLVMVLLAANLTVLHALQDQDKDKEKNKDKNKKTEATQKAHPPAPKPEPKREQAPPPRPEQKREPTPMPTPRPEQKREPTPMPPPRPEQKREPTPMPTPRPEQKHEPTPLPTPRPEQKREPTPLPTPRPEQKQGPTPLPSPRPEQKREQTPVPTPRPEQKREPIPISKDPARSPRTVPTPPGNPGNRLGPENHQVVQTRNGGEIHRTQTGAIREVHTPSGAVIRHSPSGVRHVEVARPGGRVIVANATGHTGYIQRPLVSHGQTYVQRTYIYNGVAEARIYRPWSYGGHVYHVYTPRYYYRPTFYTYVYTPWGRPVHYRWGWNSRPWYGYYGGYFTPYSTYISPSYWLADFLIASILETAYLSQNSYSSAPPVVYTSSTAMSPEVKRYIADEVRRQMDQARADQADSQRTGQISAPHSIFSSTGPRVFLVSEGLMAYSGNYECPLMEGDVLQVTRTPSPNSEWAEARVLSGRGSSCPKGSYVSVRTMDLQEMQNQMQATIDRGMAKLQADQGRDGIPAFPPQAMGTVNASYTDDVRPDLNAQDELALAVKEANRSEQDIINQGPQEPEGSGSGATISLGMTISQVEDAMGRPKNTVDLGSKKIYVYQNLKITFLDGRVSDVQ